jgi:hypothetical protein
MEDMSSTWSSEDLRAFGYPDPETEYDMPDLRELHGHDIVELSLESFTVRVGHRAGRYFTAWMNMVRLANKALRGYQAARTHLAEYRVNAYECQPVPFYRAIDNLEDAVTATHRGFLNAQCLTPVTGRQLPQPTKRQASLLRTIHDHIEHGEQNVVRTRTPASELNIVYPHDKYVEIASIQLPYQDLAWCITKLHRGVERIRS